ncbi:MAG TPA: hypothetical protein VF556_05065 [Pyrinomonadaceae bacterium]|jgi:hypothetical protein
MKRLEKPNWQSKRERKRKSWLALIGVFSVLPLIVGLVFGLKNLSFGEAFTVEGATIVVKAGGDFQAALNRAKSGDTILLEAGATFKGNFVLPKKTGSEFITIRSSASDSQLPPADTRIDPTRYASVLPKLVTATGDPVIIATNGAHHYRFLGVEFSVSRPEENVWKLISIGDDEQNRTEQVPQNIAFDRCYIHAHSRQTGSVRSGLSINGRNIEITNSHISDFRLTNDEGHAIVAWNAPGPFKIINNYIEASGIGVLFGGATAHKGMNPADLEFRRNHVTKRTEWRGKYAVKNLFELKDMRRAVIEENVFENNWASAQDGTAILFTPASFQSGPDARVEDIVFRSNIVRKTANAVTMTGTDYGDPKYPNIPVQNRNVRFENNLFAEIGGSWGDKSAGRFLLLTSGAGPDNLTLDHNTIQNTGTLIMLDAAPLANFVFTNNIGNHNEYGIIGVGKRGGGIGSEPLRAYTSKLTFRKNVIIGAEAARYPPENFYQMRLSEPNAYKGRATDGKDIGCDLIALAEMEKKVIAGVK